MHTRRDRLLRLGLRAFVPPSIPGCVLWARSDMGVTRDACVLVDGDCEAVGVAAWTPLGATLTKETASPYQGVRNIKAENAVGWGSASQPILVVGETYRATGAARGNGALGVPLLHDGVTTHWTGLADPVWQPFDVTFVATNTSICYLTGSAVVGEYTEWDALTLDCRSVTTWEDYSGSGHRLQQAVAACMPTLVAAGIGTHPSIRFDGVADWLLSSFVIAQPCEVHISAAWNNADATLRALTGGAAAASLWHQNTNDCNLEAGAGPLVGPVHTANATVYHAVYNGAASEVWLDRGAITTGAAGAAALNGIMIGARSGGDYAVADVREIVVYNRITTDAERRRLTTYMTGAML